jgi:hypothetical protein
LTRPVTSPLTATLAAINDADFIPFGTERLFKTGQNVGKFDFWPIMGQSNNMTGRFCVSSLDRRINPRIAKINNRNMYTGPFAGKICYCVEGFEDYDTGHNGYLIGYARSFAQNLLIQAPNEVPAASTILLKRYCVGGTGFANTSQPNWMPDAANTLYNQSINDILSLLDANPEIQLRGILWHQGEEDAGAYTDSEWVDVITDFIARCRSDLKTPDLSFILGGLSPDQVSFNSMTARTVALPGTVLWTGAMDPRANGQSGYPGDTSSAVIGINDEPAGIDNDATHFSAATQRAHIGPRYTKAYLSALTHNNPGGADNAYAAPDAIADLAATSNDTYVTLDFTVSDNNGAVIVGYDAQISPTGQNAWTDAPKRFCGKGRKLAGLTNGVAIDIRVRARNKAGAGDWSNVVANVTPGTVWQSEALSLFALMSSPPNDAMKLAVNAFIRDTKADGSWATFDMVQCYALNAEQSCLLDWKTQGRTVAKVGSPVFTPKIGVKPGVNTDRISTGFNPGDGGTYNLGQTNLMLCVVVNEESQNNQPDLGCTGSINLGIYARQTTDTMRANLNDNSGTTTVPNTTSVGRFYATRELGSGNTKRFYRNGASLGTFVASTSAINNATMQALGHAGTNSSLRQVAMAIAGSGLTAAQIATLDTRLSALLSALAAS